MNKDLKLILNTIFEILEIIMEDDLLKYDNSLLRNTMYDLRMYLNEMEGDENDK
jgi:hypothetical protein